MNKCVTTQREAGLKSGPVREEVAGHGTHHMVVLDDAENRKEEISSRHMQVLCLPRRAGLVSDGRRAERDCHGSQGDL